MRTRGRQVRLTKEKLEKRLSKIERRMKELAENAFIIRNLIDSITPKEETSNALLDRPAQEITL